jgi:hypothetical protein
MQKIGVEDIASFFLIEESTVWKNSVFILLQGGPKVGIPKKN